MILHAQNPLFHKAFEAQIIKIERTNLRPPHLVGEGLTIFMGEGLTRTERTDFGCHTQIAWYVTLRLLLQKLVSEFFLIFCRERPPGLINHVLAVLVFGPGCW